MAWLDAQASILFTLFYVLFWVCFFLQTKEFSSAGLSPENFLGMIGWLGQRPDGTGSEELKFLDYHIRKTSGTLILYASVPLVYLLGYTYFAFMENPNGWDEKTFQPEVASATSWYFIVSVMMIVTASSIVFSWSINNWSHHPFVKKLSKYCVNNSWTDVVKDINNEFRRIDKLSIKTNPVVKVVVTDNWILMVGQWPWNFHLAHQSDVELKVVKTDQHQLSTEGQAGGTQFLSILVKNRRDNSGSFTFRLNSLEYQNLQDKVRGPIQNIENIHIYKSVTERFIEVFREEVEKNPRATVNEEVDNCIGCMVAPSDVKLLRRCDTIDSDQPQEENNQPQDSCVTCYCRPMWCITCMGKWFASRQDQKHPETWLGSRCPCPTCRSKFCILDVSLIETTEGQE